MPIGSIFKQTFSSYVDPHTGVNVKRLTDPSILSHHMYFYHRMRSKDGRHLLICQIRDEGRQIYLLDTTKGETLQLSEGQGINDESGILGLDDKTVYYMQNNKFYKININTLEREIFYESPEGYSAGGVGMGYDDKYMVLIETELSTMPAPTPGKWDGFAANCLAKPHCRIVKVDIEAQTSHIVHEDNCWLGHAQLRPMDNDTIMFCHEGPYDLIDARLWLVQSDGSNLRCCRDQANDLIITHEFWLPDGSQLAFVYRETTSEMIENIRMIDPDTLEESILMACSPFAHFISDHSNRYMVGDAQGIDKPIHLLTEEEIIEDHKKGIIRNDFIYLIDVENKKEIKACYHGTSWLAKYGNAQDPHPHPCFSDDDSKIIFVSDREGLPCIYEVEVKDILSP